MPEYLKGKRKSNDDKSQRVERGVIKPRLRQIIEYDLREIDKQINIAEIEYAGTEEEVGKLLPLYRKWHELNKELWAL